MDVYTALIALLVAFIIYQFLKTEDRVATYVNKIPGPLRLPLIGTTYKILTTPRKDLFNVSKTNLRSYGTIIRTWIGNKPVVHVISEENIEVILNSSVHINKGFHYDLLRPWLGDGLLTSSGKKWHSHRKLITPAFHFQMLESFMGLFIEKSRILVEQLRKKADGEIFDVYPNISRCTLDIICETAMGIQVNAMSSEDNEYVKAVNGITQCLIYRLLRPFLHPDFTFLKTKQGKLYQKYLATLHNFTYQAIENRKNLRKTKGSDSGDDSLGRKKRMAFLDLLLEQIDNGLVLTDLEIREEVDTFMFEGHDTTAASIGWTLFLLGNHKDIQEKVHEEADNVFQGQKKNLTINDLGELKLLERCIKEALRLYPSVPIISRLLKEDVVLENYLVPAGCTVAFPIFLINREEKHFPDPETFDPDRFLPENTKNRHPYAYVPFSAGSRNCIGQKFAMYEEKTLLAYLLREFKVKSVETQETVRPLIEFVLRPLNGFKIVLERRK